MSGLLPKNIKRLPGACPVAVQYPEDFRDDLGEYTDQVHPVSLQNYLEILKLGAKMIPPGFKAKVTELQGKDNKDKSGKVTTQTAEEIYRGLPMCADNKFCTVIDSEGNVCMQGEQEKYLEETKALIKENELMKMQDDNLIIDAGKKLQSYYNNNENKLKKVTDLIEMYESYPSEETTEREILSINRDSKDLIKGNVTKDDNPTGGCGSIYPGDETGKIQASLTLPKDRTKLGATPSKRQTRFPITELEANKPDEEYGPGRVPLQIGQNPDSVICTHPSNKDFQDQNIIMAKLLRRVQKKNQSTENLLNRSVEYENANVVSHATKAFVCADLPKNQCTSNISYKEYGYKVPFGMSEADGGMSNATNCKWDTIPGKSGRTKQMCIPNLGDNQIDYNQKSYGKKYWNWYENDVTKGKYQKFASDKMKEKDNYIQYSFEKPSKLEGFLNKSTNK